MIPQNQRTLFDVKRHKNAAISIGNIQYPRRHKLCKNTMLPPNRITLQVLTTAPKESVANTTAKTRDGCRIEVDSKTARTLHLKSFNSGPTFKVDSSQRQITLYWITRLQDARKRMLSKSWCINKYMCSWIHWYFVFSPIMKKLGPHKSHCRNAFLGLVLCEPGNTTARRFAAGTMWFGKCKDAHSNPNQNYQNRYNKYWQSRARMYHCATRTSYELHIS